MTFMKGSSGASYPQLVIIAVFGFCDRCTAKPENSYGKHFGMSQFIRNVLIIDLPLVPISHANILKYLPSNNKCPSIVQSWHSPRTIRAGAQTHQEWKILNWDWVNRKPFYDFLFITLFILRQNQSASWRLPRYNQYIGSPVWLIDACADSLSGGARNTILLVVVGDIYPALRGFHLWSGSISLHNLQAL